MEYTSYSMVNTISKLHALKLPSVAFLVLEHTFYMLHWWLYLAVIA